MKFGLKLMFFKLQTVILAMKNTNFTSNFISGKGKNPSVHPPPPEFKLINPELRIFSGLKEFWLHLRNFGCTEGILAALKFWLHLGNFGLRNLIRPLAALKACWLSLALNFLLAVPK